MCCVFAAVKWISMPQRNQVMEVMDALPRSTLKRKSECRKRGIHINQFDEWLYEITSNMRINVDMKFQRRPVEV